MQCDVGLRIVLNGGTCIRCKIDGVPMCCTLGTPEGGKLGGAIPPKRDAK